MLLTTFNAFLVEFRLEGSTDYADWWQVSVHWPTYMTSCWWNFGLTNECMNAYIAVWSVSCPCTVVGVFGHLRITGTRPTCIYIQVLIEVAFLYWCPDCPRCQANTIQKGWAARTKYNRKMIITDGCVPVHVSRTRQSLRASVFNSCIGNCRCGG